jgi:hypothetical protein
MCQCDEEDGLLKREGVDYMEELFQVAVGATSAYYLMNAPVNFSGRSRTAKKSLCMSGISNYLD